MVNIQKTMESHHFLARKIHYFDWAIFNSKLLVYRYFPWKWMILKNLICFPYQKCYLKNRRSRPGLAEKNSGHPWIVRQGDNHIDAPGDATWLQKRLVVSGGEVESL
jgi:hypothetical protein